MAGDGDFPVQVAEVAEAIGLREALFLVGRLCPPKRERGASVRGRQGCLYVPKRVTPRLLERVGCPDIARALVAAFPGETRWFPPCQGLVNRHRDAAIRRMVAGGARHRDVAWMFDICTRMVGAICRK